MEREIKMNKKITKIVLIIGGGILLSLFWYSAAHATSLADQVREPVIVNIWKIVLDIVNIVAILGLILIAIVNILRINIEAFNIRRMLPALILGIIFANFSHLICRLFIDFATVFTVFFKEGIHFSLPIDARTVGQAFGITQPVGAGATFGVAAVLSVIGGFLITPVGGLIIFVILSIIIFLFPTVLIVILALMMYIRLYVIWFLVIMSPLGFFGLFFEPAKIVWNMWWNWFIKWLMIAPIAFFFLRLAVEVGNLGQGAGASQVIGGGSAVSHFATWIFGLGMLGLAIYMPYSIGGQIMGLAKGLAANLLKGAGFTKALGGYAMAKAGKRWKNEGRTSFRRGAGSAMERIGKGLQWKPSTNIQDLLKDMQSKEAVASREHPIGALIGGERAGTELIIRNNETAQGMPDEVSVYEWGGGSDRKGAMAQYVAGLASGKYQKAIDVRSDDLARGAVAYQRLMAAASGGNRFAAEKLTDIYNNAGVDLTVPDDDLNPSMRTAKAAFERFGKFTEGVSGRELPPLPTGGSSPTLPTPTPAPPIPTPTSPPPPTPTPPTPPTAPTPTPANPAPITNEQVQKIETRIKTDIDPIIDKSSRAQTDEAVRKELEEELNAVNSGLDALSKRDYVEVKRHLKVALKNIPEMQIDQMSDDEAAARLLSLGSAYQAVHDTPDRDPETIRKNFRLRTENQYRIINGVGQSVTESIGLSDDQIGLAIKDQLPGKGGIELRKSLHSAMDSVIDTDPELKVMPREQRDQIYTQIIEQHAPGIIQLIKSGRANAGMVNPDSAENQQIAGNLAEAILRAARNVASAGSNTPVFKKFRVAGAAKENPNYHIQENPDGSGTVIGERDPDTGKWAGVAPPNQKENK